MPWRDLARATPRGPAPHAPQPPEGVLAGMCVLASGSSGNCSVLRVRDGGGRWTRTCLIDAGLSPTRTRRLLAERGIGLGEIDDILLTHLDSDHFHASWTRVRDCRATLRLHHRHVPRAERSGLLMRRNEPFGDELELPGGIRLESVLMSHDSLGVAAFRFAFPDGAELGFATDVGRATDHLVDHLHAVDVLAIESNYCPRMQADSPRPAFLKARITGGSGHLSNQECRDAVGRIAPASEVVLLHLSRQCNTPELAAGPHEGAPYRLTLSNQFEATGWVWIRPSGRPRPARKKAPWSDLELFAAPAP